MKMMQCDRCREMKEADRFRPNQPSWLQWCIRCERTPVGSLPYPQTNEDWRK